MTTYYADVYDDLLLQANGPMTVAEARQAFIETISTDARNGDLPEGVEFELTMNTWAELAYLKSIPQMRDTRRTNLSKVLGGLRSALSERMSQPRVLSQAYALGDGTDLSLRYWSRDHWLRAGQARQERAREASDAAQEFMGNLNPMLAAFDSAGAAFTWQLFEQGSGNAAA